MKEKPERPFMGLGRHIFRFLIKKIPICKFLKHFVIKNFGLMRIMIGSVFSNSLDSDLDPAKYLDPDAKHYVKVQGELSITNTT
jgi:hypothetical protein